MNARRRIIARPPFATPDLILQVAHRVADELRARGVRKPEVRAEVWVSLNGRRSSLMIDPNVDLTSIADGVAPAHWILPAPADPPLAPGLKRPRVGAS